MQPPIPHVDVRLTSALKQFAALAAATTALVGLLALIGWAFDISAFKRLWPGLTAMVPLTAVGFMLAGVALGLLRQAEADARGRRLGQVCASVVVLIGGLTLLEYALSVNFGIDQWLFSEAVRAEGALFPGRPSIATALSLLLLGLALLTIDVKSVWLAPLFTLIPLFIAMLAIVGYAYGVTVLYQIGSYVPIALNTAFTFTLFTLGLMAARPQHPAWRVITTNLGGGVIARRLLPAAILLPFGLGWLRLIGQHLGWYDTEFGLALFATSNIVIFVSLTYWNASLLNQADAKREAAYANLRESEGRFRFLADAMPNGLIMASSEGRIVLANKQAEVLFGYRPGQLLEQKIETLVPDRFREGHPAYREAFAARPQARPMGAGRDLFGRRLDGTEFPIEIGLNPVEMQEGSFTLAAIIDITERKQAEERFRLLADAAPNGLIMVDKDGRIALANKQTGFMFGYEPGRLLGQMVDRLVPERFRSGHPAHREAYILNPQVRLMGAGRDLFGQRLDGTEFPIEIGLNPIETSKGSFTLAAIIDITERQRAQVMLQKSEDRFAKAFRASPVALSVTRMVDGCFVDVNDQFIHLLGYSRPELIGHTSIELNMFLDPDERAELIERLRAEGTVRNQELAMRSKSGEIRQVLFSTEQIELEGEAHALATLIDITERQQAENEIRSLNATLERRVAERTAELQVQEAKLRTLFEVLPVGVSILNRQRQIVEANPALERIFNISKQDLIQGAYSGWQTIYPDGTPLPSEALPSLRALEEQQTILNVEVGVMTGSGNTIWTSVSAVPLTIADLGVVVVTTDITERRRVEMALRESEQRFAKAFSASPAALSLTRLADDCFIDVNENYLNLFGYRREEVVGRSSTELAININPDERAELARQFREQGSVHNYEIVLSTRAGQPLNMLFFAEPLEINGEAHILATLLDITERKRVEQALRESEQRFATIFRASPAAISISRLTDGRFIEVNESFLRLIGYERAEVIGHTAPELKLRVDSQSGAQAIQVLREHRSIHDLESRIYRKSGEIVDVLSSVEVIDLHGEPCSLALSYDITERKQGQARLAAALQEKEVLLKEIHHRVKNNLQVISSLLWLQADVLPDPQTRALFADSQRRVRAMALIHEQLYQSPDLAHINFENYASSLVNYLRRSHTRTNSNLQVQINIESLSLEIDQAMPLGMIINELVSNSLKHAFASETPDQVNEIWVTMARDPAGNLTLIVGDTGAGLPDAVDIEQSPSMGLQLVQSFVTQLQGRLMVQRKPGAIFTVIIPQGTEGTQGRDGHG